MKKLQSILLWASIVTLTTGSVYAAPNNNKPPKTDADGKPYIVTYKDSVPKEQSFSTTEDIGKKKGLKLKHKYQHAVKGFSADIPDSKVQEVKNDPRVASVTEDPIDSIEGQAIPRGIKRVGANPSLNANKGTGVGVAVLDTGIDLQHPDLKGNIVASKNCVDPSKNGDDDNNHGSHVAGILAAQNNTTGIVGVASGAKLIAVKVLGADASGYRSDIICGIDWVTANAARYNIKVANMSLSGSGASDNNCGLTNGDTYHQAICRSTVNAGITYVVAAGNTGTNASTRVPAAYNDTVITVSALNDTDGRRGKMGRPNNFGADDSFPQFSNYGAVVDIAAPGTNVLSANKSGGYMRMWGTSMAAPHVAGAAAMYVRTHPGATWKQVLAALHAKAEKRPTSHTITARHPERVLWTDWL
jgi:subtilisin family serine protease